MQNFKKNNKLSEKKKIGFIYLFLNFISIFIFNVVKKLSPHVTDKEVELIKTTKLFSHIDKNKFEELIKSVRIIKYPNEKIIFDINKPPDALYIISEGSINVYTYSLQRAKICLVTLSKGDYFSQLLISGYGKRIPNINIETIAETTLIKIKTTSIIPLQEENTDVSHETTKLKDEIICTCMAVSREQIQELINQGIKTLDQISELTGACTVCRACQYKIEKMLGENPWIPATVTNVINHAPNIRSYIIKPKIENYKLHVPGQHIILQININNQLVERAFTLSNRPNRNGMLRITVKKDPKGLLTPWLFEKEQFEILITRPQGSFLLNMGEVVPAICFAGGIGITPFIAFTEELAEIFSNKKLHILYCTTSEEEYIFKDEFNKISQTIPSFTISYWNVSKKGMLPSKEIIKLVNNFNLPDIYICGPEGFEQFVSQTLQNINYDPNKIYIERFIY